MRRILAVVVTGVLFVTACGNDASTPVATDPVDGETFSGTVPGVDGTDIDLAAFAETDAVVWFWAPW